MLVSLKNQENESDLLDEIFMGEDMPKFKNDGMTLRQVLDANGGKFEMANSDFIYDNLMEG